MNPTTVVLSSMLFASAVTAGSINAVRHRSSFSSEEYGRSSEVKIDINQASYGVLPKTFDAREHWKQCPSIGTVQDQGCCSASYALIPAAVMTDRTCIATNSSKLVYSALDPLLCCEDCWNTQTGNCFGGDSEGVWKYWTTTGIATEECMPFSYTKCFTQRECPIECSHRAKGSVAENKTKGLGYYTVTPHVLHIQSEIFHNGPVEASIDVHIHFIDGTLLVKNYVKIIGWGTDNGVPYWLVINTFGPGQGVSKVLRGQNFRNIEANVRAAKPDL